ncbi:MAG: histidine kinase [Gammaproteobacteria bacterium]|nr:histidine kinase [Gammaproteobacteria bacterium]
MSWQKSLEDRNKLFWLLHAAGWVGFALVHYIGSLMNDMRDIYVFIVLSNAFWGGMLSLPLRSLYRSVWELAPWKLIVTILLSSYVTGLIWVVIQNFTYWEFYKFGYRPDEWIWYFRNSLGGFYIILCWSGLYFGIKYYQMLQKEKQKALKASSMANEAQLKMLRYQLNPHFLFNTLNAISTLILCQENKTANGMVSKLSDFLRYSLHTDPIKKVPLDQEIKALSLYLEIEKIRFAESLVVEWDIVEQAKQALVPSLLLQPIIENAIKYGISARSNGGTIKIVAKTFGHDLLLEVSDDGPGLSSASSSSSKGEGVGISNIKDRLQNLFDDYSFTLSENVPSGLKVNIRIPLEFDR